MKYWILIALTALIGRAEWSNDPGSPVYLGSGIQPQIVATSDGGAYVAWLSDGNFHIYLQRLDANGDPQWSPDGLLVSDAPNSSWIAFYHVNLVVDASNNAIISSVDTRTGNWEVYVYKIDPEGNHLWDENGLALSSSGLDNISPRLVVEPSANSVVVTWSDNYNSLRLQRVSSEGQLLWGPNGMNVSTFNANLMSPQPALSSDDYILVQAIKQTGSFPALSSQVLLQKYSLEGNSQWPSWFPLSSAASFPLGNWLQDLQPDQLGGAFSAWTELTGLNQTGKVQSVDASGSLLWTSPVEASLAVNNFRVSPRLAATGDSSGVYVVWGESDANQINRGILAQKIDTTGTRLWGEMGLAVEPMGSSSFLDIQAGEMEHDLLLTYIRQFSFGSTDIFASRLDPDGSFIWDPDLVQITNSAAQKSDLSMGRGQNCAFLVWSENGSINAHCLLNDGSLGVPVDPPPDTLNYFPMAVGQRWSYSSVFDSTTITIVDSFLINEDTYFVFEDWYPNEPINNFHRDGFEVLVNAGAADQLIYDFGADLNDMWNFNFPGTDVSEMTLTSRGDTLETPYGTFTNCIGFHRYIGADYEYYDWFAPDIGLVQRDVVTFAGPLRYQLYNIEQVLVGIDQKDHQTPDAFILMQNYPNPFNPTTSIQYELPRYAEISVVIYDVNGSLVTVLQKGFQQGGRHQLTWQGTDQFGASVPAGLYFCQTSGPGFNKTIKMVILK